MTYFDLIVCPLGEELGSILESGFGAFVLLEGGLFLLGNWLGHVVK